MALPDMSMIGEPDIILHSHGAGLLNGSRLDRGRNRRLAKDFEPTIDSARAFLYAASVMLLVRRLARVS